MSGDRIDLLAEIHRLEEENKELKRVNKLKHELYQEQKERADRLDKGLDKACQLLSTVIEIEGCNGFCGNYPNEENCRCNLKEFWKGKCLEDE